MEYILGETYIRKNIYEDDLRYFLEYELSYLKFLPAKPFIWVVRLVHHGTFCGLCFFAKNEVRITSERADHLVCCAFSKYRLRTGLSTKLAIPHRSPIDQAVASIAAQIAALIHETLRHSRSRVRVQ